MSSEKIRCHALDKAIEFHRNQTVFDPKRGLLNRATAEEIVETATKFTGFLTVAVQRKGS